MNKKFKFEKYTIANLTNILILFMAIVNILDIITNTPYSHFQIQMLLTDQWWQIFLFPFRITDNLLSLILFLYIFWLFGNMLEQELGIVKYNLFIFSGYFFILIGTYFYPLDAYYVYLSVFFAVAYLYPDMEILLFFILPIKMKWIGIFTGAFLLYNAVILSLKINSLLPILGPILGLLNFILLIVLPDIRNKTPKLHQIKFQINKREENKPLHKCTICGITEKDDPYMDFRYCVECSDHEYCRDHLYNHEHIKD
ncbi:MAG: hypothetical protein KatS3mg129_1192 [Leptospiraceae bacterium]|nr:MAG: hypothetical protein KatS3mg129_1192 [Leptospiraceae bacterium]